MDFFYILVGIIINIIVTFILSTRYKLLLAQLHEKISLIHSIFTTCAFYTLSYISFLKVDALLARPIITKAFTNGSFRAPFAAFSFEFVFDFALQIILFLVLIAITGYNIISTGAIVFYFIFICIFSISIFILFKMRRQTISRIQNFLPEKFKKMKFDDNFIKRIFGDVKQIYNNKYFLIKLTLITLLYVFIMPLTVWSSAKSFGVALPYYSIFTIFWLSYVVGRLSGLPNGVGTRDAIVIGLLMSTGVILSAALKIALIYRLILITPNLLFGVPVLLYLGKRGFSELKTKMFSQPKN